MLLIAMHQLHTKKAFSSSQIYFNDQLRFLFYRIGYTSHSHKDPSVSTEVVCEAGIILAIDVSILRIYIQEL